MTYNDLPEEARAQIGKETQPLASPVAVEQALVDHWLEVFEDTNPVYWDEEYAKKSRYGGRGDGSCRRYKGSGTWGGRGAFYYHIWSWDCP